MDQGSTTMALTTGIRKRSISSHHNSSTDTETRALIKTKIQKIDGHYQVSPTCRQATQQQTQIDDNSSDDQDEPLVVGTVPPLVQNNSEYRTRQDTYDDEAGDDQLSNSSSADSSPVRPTKSYDDHEHNQSSNETSVHIPTMSTKSSTDLINDDNHAEQIKVSKKSNTNKSSLSNSSSAMSIEEEQTQDEILSKGWLFVLFFGVV